MSTKGDVQRAKDTNALFRDLMDRDKLHVRVGESRRRYGETFVSYVGTIAELHGPEGVCTCCHGRRP